MGNTEFYNGNTIKNKQFYLTFFDAISYAKQLGIKISLPGHSGLCNTCSSYKNPKGLVLTSDGNLYSCWESAGKKGKIVGDINNGFYKDRFKQWIRCGEGGKNNNLINQIFILETLAALEKIDNEKN